MSQNVENRQRKTKLLPLIGRISFLVAVLFVVIYVVTIIVGSNDYIVDFAKRSAYIDFDQDVKQADQLAEVHYENLYGIVSRLEYATSHDDVVNVVGEYIGSEEYGDLRFYVQGQAYDPYGTLVPAELAGGTLLSDLAKSNKRGNTEVYFDPMVKQDCIAFFVPVRGSVYVDGLLSIVPARHLINTGSLLSETADALLLIDHSGTVLDSTVTESFQYSIGADFFEFLNLLTEDNAQVGTVSTAISDGTKSVCTLGPVGNEFALCVAPLSSFSGRLFLVSLTRSQGMVSPELVFVRQVTTIGLIAVMALSVGIIASVGYSKKMRNRLVNAAMTDSSVGCPNTEQFKLMAGKLMQSDRARRYAVSISEIRQFQYITENLDETDVTELLQFIAKVLETFCGPTETYGYLGEGKFVMLIAYEHDRSIKDKVRLIETIVTKNAVLGSSKAKRKFNVGVSIMSETRRQTLQELIGYAGIACEKAKNDINAPYVLFNEQINSERMHNEQIEAEMETALANGEFRLFLQPKYNVAGDRVDSAEALVRWFDAKKGDYRFPGEFIGLFEANGFITKLDHFMYLEALKYLSAAAEKGEKLVPISVNVSMVTVNSGNFPGFYIENKNKFGVGDNFITIEFTESFAVDDYQRMRDIVSDLHRNGIRCSLDDFGTGYSSLGTLKNIPFDELKFDRMLMSVGVDKEKDALLLETMYRLAKDLGIRVIQEGVENQIMFENVVAKGCDVIQGYYYAKAIPVEEYRLFINSNTSIKYKALVK